MTFLPILERELRMRARSRGNYWGRFIVAAAGVLVCAPPLIWSFPFATPGQIGHGVFDGLVGAAFLLCCVAAMVTCDTISSERREGTLGLLLLTRVKHIDVLLGKFGSSGLTSLLSLLAFLPILVLPLLTGGVTGGEAARKFAALLNTLFLALSIGLWASARSVARFRAARAALLVLAAVIFLPPLVGWIFGATYIEMASPLVTLLEAGAAVYQKFPFRYWLSLGLVQIVSLVLLVRAAASVRDSLGESENESNTFVALDHQAGENCPTGPTVVLSGSDPASSKVSCHYCGRPNEVGSVYCQECGVELFPRKPELPSSAKLSSAPSALHWLLRRRRGLKPMLWLGAVLGFFNFSIYGIFGRFFFGGVSLLMSVSWTLSLVTSAITGALFALVASRFFVDARRTGELELLLTTPVGAQEIVSTQWDILKRLLWFPIALMLLPLVLQMLMTLTIPYSATVFWRPYSTFSLLLSGLNTIFGTFAVCWLALWLGLRINGQGRVILWSVLIAKGLPCGFVITWWLLCQYLFRQLTQPGNWAGVPWMLSSFLPSITTLLFFMWLIRLARRQLKELVRPEPLNPLEMLSQAWPRLVAAVRRARQWRQI